MDWLFVRSKSEPGAARFSHMLNYEDDYLLKKAVSLKDTFPREAEVKMKADFPNDIQLVDSLNSAAAYLIVRENVCDLLRDAGVENVEFLPIAVINHKKKRVKDAYFVLNILSHVDCIDVAKSQGLKWNEIDPTMIGGVKKLALDPARLPGDVKIFRPSNMAYRMLIHRSLSDRIVSEKLLGFSFTEVDKFSE